MNKTMFLALLCLCGANTFGDVIPEGHHTVQRSVYIRNVSAFPDYVIIASVTPPSGMFPSGSLVQDRVALDMGYKFNRFELYTIKRTLLESLGGLDSINLAVVIKTLPGAQVPSPWGYTIENTNPLAYEKLYYEIISINDQAMTIALKERHCGYNNGTADKIEQF